MPHGQGYNTHALHILTLCQQFHVETNNDHLMEKPLPPWFEALIWMELFFQLPFFIVASVAFAKGWNWIRIPCIVYGSSAFTSMMPILGYTLTSERINDAQRFKLIGIYSPWIVLPLVLIVLMGMDERPFGDGKGLASGESSKKRS
ncbi:unnamed protein product [Choristocarpus tenellus]